MAIDQDMENTEMTGSTRLKPGENEVIVRMYRQGLGDCFLLAFPTADKEEPRYVLIDCGIHMRQSDGNKRLLQVSNNIIAATGGRIHVVVPTHEHADHLVGFVQKGSPFLKMNEESIDQVWFAWTEKFGDPQADQLRANRFIARSVLKKAVEKLRDNAKLLLNNDAKMQLEYEANKVVGIMGFEMTDPPETQSKSKKSQTVDETALERKIKACLKADPMKRATHQTFDRYFDTRDSLVGVDGVSADSAKTKSRRPSSNEKALLLLSLLGKQSKYCEPGDTLEIEGVKNVRAYVLGPPRNSKLLKKDSPSKVRGGHEHEYKETYLNGRSSAIAFGLSPELNVKTGVPENLRMPFSNNFGKEMRSNSRFVRKYKEEEWRMIDADWLGSAEALALHLDGDTNNTSIVLAFELGDPGKGSVLLFTGDAQVGNWLSWRDQEYGEKGNKFSADDLMRRTTLYKVGHHGSHNSTLKNDPRDASTEGGAPFGLELMNDIIAMIPVHENAVEKNMPHPWRMPHKPMYERLREKANLRVLRSDQSIKPLIKPALDDLIPPETKFTHVPGKRGCKWRKSVETFRNGTDDAEEPMYYEVSFHIS